MKLPEIKFTMGVQPLGKLPIGTALSVANAQAGAARQTSRALLAEGAADASLGELAGQIGISAAQIGAVYMDWQNQKAMNDADLKVAKEMTRWDSEVGTQRFIPGSQIPDSIQAQRTEIVNDPVNGQIEVERQVPIYEVGPQMRKAYRSEITTQQSETIPNPGKKDSWLVKQQIATEEMYGKDSVRAAQQYTEAEKERYEIEFNEAMRDNQWEMAEQIIRNMPATPVKKRAMFTVLSKAQTSSYLDEILTQRDIGAMTHALEEVRTGFNSLSDSEEKAYASSLLTAIRQEENAVTSGNKVKFDNILQDAKDYISAVQSGLPVSPHLLSSSMDALTAIEGLDARVPMVKRSMETMMQLSGELAAFNGTSTQAQDYFLDELRGKASKPQDFTRLRLLESARDRNASDRQKDTLLSGSRAGLYDLAEVSWNELRDQKQFGTMATVLAQRRQQAGMAYNQYETFTGFLTNEEGTEWANMFERVKPSEQIDLLRVVHEGLGKDAPLFYEQLGDLGMKGSFVVAGQLAAQGSYTAADIILRGDRIRKDNAEVTSRIKEDFIRTLPEYLGNVYVGNPKRRGRVRDAILSAYATQAEGDKDFESLNEDYFEQAIQIATGGIIEYNNMNIEAPSPGVTRGIFKKWMNNLEPAYIASLGDPLNFSPKQVINFIKDGTLKLRSKARSEYYVYDPDHDSVLMDKSTNAPFVFKYQTDLSDEYLSNIQAAQKRTEAYAKDIAEGRSRSPKFLPSQDVMGDQEQATGLAVQ